MRTAGATPSEPVGFVLTLAQQYLSLYRVLARSLKPHALRHPCANIEPS
jgi:hypothetical protein